MSRVQCTLKEWLWRKKESCERIKQEVCEHDGDEIDADRFPECEVDTAMDTV